MRIYISVYSDEIYEGLRYRIIERGNEVMDDDTLYSSAGLIEAAILVLPSTKEQKIYDSYLRIFANKYQFLSNFLPSERICIVSDKNYNYFGSRNHRIVGYWPSIWAKINRWIDGISVNKKNDKLYAMNSIQFSLEKAMYVVLNNQKSFDNVRVFSFSTTPKARYMSILNAMKIKKATILLREFTIIDEFLQLSEEKSFSESIDLWKKMKESGTIDVLEIYRFDFHPTYCMYIFDDRYVIWGNLYYDFKKEKYSFDKDVLLIDSSTNFGKLFIKKSIYSFDKLTENYRGL